jgi:hypothetical protein
MKEEARANVVFARASAFPKNAPDQSAMTDKEIGQCMPITHTQA